MGEKKNMIILSVIILEVVKNRETSVKSRFPDFNKERRRWDSNPRAPEGKRISSAPRYDHFDTSPSLVTLLERQRSALHRYGFVLYNIRV